VLALGGIGSWGLPIRRCPGGPAGVHGDLITLTTRPSCAAAGVVNLGLGRIGPGALAHDGLVHQCIYLESGS
jgi:hypothetical protein